MQDMSDTTTTVRRFCVSCSAPVEVDAHGDNATGDQVRCDACRVRPAITAKGRELAWKLNPAIGTTRDIEATCSLIARYATTHHRIQEVLCNGGDDWRSDDARNRQIEAAERKDERLEARITELVEYLPHTDDGPFGVKFGGDPRGCTVKITAPGEFERMHDDWGREGICVPQGH